MWRTCGSAEPSMCLHDFRRPVCSIMYSEYRGMQLYIVTMAHWFIAIYGRSIFATLWVNVAARMTQLCLVCYVNVGCECMDVMVESVYIIPPKIVYNIIIVKFQDGGLCNLVDAICIPLYSMFCFVSSLILCQKWALKCIHGQ